MTSWAAMIPSIPLGMHFSDFPAGCSAWPFSPQALEKLEGTEVFILGFSSANTEEDILVPCPLCFP